ncbi:DUF620 family protein (DUF620) [Rhynchospora pubera]|uniref:DUF620 family protein (DUF620) n=1 Tax=Rhynchospora pubera TaxID=906938 RepID=A0AAV8C1H9_9POAL|nr:DUF620 family protein (DUF620) [Rhynchospora pubera]
MRRLCPNLDLENALDTVLEVPIPEEMYNGPIPDMRAWLKSQAFDKACETDACTGFDQMTTVRPQMARISEIQMLMVLSTPLIPCPIPHDRAFSRSIHDRSVQASTARYILQQYIAATGGQDALQSVDSMYAVGKLHICTSAFYTDMEEEGMQPKGKGEYGTYVLWQKSPELWYFDFIMAGCKLTMGCNGHVAWKQSTMKRSCITKGPPRPLRRSLQGLDPRATANIFSGAVCIGEKTISEEECFILKLDASPAALQDRSSDGVEVIHHTIWGFFSQRTGLLMQLEDSLLLCMKNPTRLGPSRDGGDSGVYWETHSESVVGDYRYINGINIAHAGHTTGTMLRYGSGAVNHKLKIEETWVIEEADFNLSGLTSDYFLPPADLNEGSKAQEK